MKLDKSQRIAVKQLVRDSVSYQETFEEVTDHLLSALEEREETNEPFESTIAQLLNREFGGSAALRQLEKEREKMVQRAIRKKQLNYVLEHFKIPLIGFTLLVGGLTYYMVDTVISRKAFSIVIFCMAAMPMLLIAVRKIRRLFSRYKIKESVKDPVVMSISYFTISILNVILFLPQLFYTQQDYKSFMHLNIVVLSAIMVFYTVYTISFIKVYREELSMQMV